MHHLQWQPVCGATLALLDAGVPLKRPVAGIGVGLIKEGEQEAILTDMLGTEDFLGDMDFKVAGTSEGVTAIQMDIKIEGVTPELMPPGNSSGKRGHVCPSLNR